MDRIEWIDYTKAFACLLVVLGHLLMSLTVISDNYLIEYIIYTIYLFHMPLFMCISGILYFKNKKDFNWKNYKKFELKKIINLAIPYFTFYIIFMTLNTIFSNAVNTAHGFKGWIGIFNHPIAPYWYLYSLLSIFIVVPLIEKICKNNTKIVFSIFFLLKIYVIFNNTNLYFLNTIMNYGIYFYFGTFIKYEKINDKNNNNFLMYLTIFLYLLLALIVFNIPTINSYLMSFINILFAIFGILICIKIFKNITHSKILDTYKNYTFQIYLLHTICAGGVRILMFKIGIYNYLIHLVVGIIISIYAPVVISKISEKIGYTEFFFFPVKTINKYKKEVSK